MTINRIRARTSDSQSNMDPNCRTNLKVNRLISMTKLASIGRMAILGCITDISSAAMGQDKFQRLTGSQIRVRIAGMQMTDEVHWRYVYDRNGSLRTQSMGRTRVGKWSIQKDELCLDLGDGPDSGCFEVWLSGGNVDMRPTGLGLPLQGVIERATDCN